MGNSSGVIPTATSGEIFKDFQLLGVEDNPRFGDISLYRDKNKGDVMWVKEIKIEDRDAETHFETYYASDIWKDRIFLTKQVFKVGGSDGMLCSSNNGGSSKLVVFMEFHDIDLESEISQRASEQVKDFFKEPEIWYIVESIMNLEAVVLKQHRFQGDLRTCNIFISEDGFTKFADPSFIDYRSNCYFKVMTGAAKCNISPEYLQSFHANQKEPKSNPEIADVFALGIVILSICNLREDASYYDWYRKEILWNQVWEGLDFIQHKYSPLLWELAKGCLKEKGADRIHMSDILNFIDQRKASGES